MIRRRVTLANVVSFLALFVALSAASYAAIALPANSVGTKQIKAKAVKAAKLAANAVSTPKIKSHAVDGSKIAPDAIDTTKVKDGSLTGADLNLPTIGKVPAAVAADSAGSAPIALVKQVTGAGTVPDSGGAAVTVTCDAGLAVIGCGVSIDPNHGIEQGSYPSATNAWVGSVFGDTGTPFTVYALCAPAASTQ